MSRRVLTISDRVEISTGVKAGQSVRSIGQNASVVSREIARNAGVGGRYVPVTEDVKAEKRRGRPRVRKVDADPVVQERVWADLGRGRSPRQIAGRLAAEAGDTGLAVAVGSPHGQGRTVSHEAIYTWRCALPKGELARHGVRLDSGRTRRKPRAHLGKRPGPIVGMRSIEDRPAEAEDRKVPGRWEGDLIIGAAGASAAATLVERTTRFTVILALQDGKNADGLAQSLIDTVTSWPAPFTPWSSGRRSGAFPGGVRGWEPLGPGRAHIRALRALKNVQFDGSELVP